MFHEPLFQVAGAANSLPGLYYLWRGMNDSRVKWFLSTDDYETLSDGRYLSKRLRLEHIPSCDELIPKAYMINTGVTRGITQLLPHVM